MNRMIRGMAVMLVALGASACGEDPSVDFGGDAPTKIQASPTVMFVNQGAQKFVKVRLVDDRNRSTATSFEISNVSPGITVVLDETYRPDFIGSDGLEFNPIQHEHRLIVTGVAPVGAQFTVSSSGISQVIQVNVIPTELPLIAAGGNGTTDPTAITSENFTFDASTVFTAGGYRLPVISISEDGHTANVIVPANLPATDLVVTGARASYMPTVALPALTGSVQVSGPGSGGLAGTDDPNTAPTLTMTGLGFGWADAGPFTGPTYGIVANASRTKVYKLVVPADMGEVDISIDWDASAGADIDLYLVDGDFAAILGAAENGNNADHPPETVTHDLPAGTYYIVALLWQNNGTSPQLVYTINAH